MTSYACPLCQHSFDSWMQLNCDWRRPDNADRYELNWCPSCELGQLCPRPDAEKIASFYAIDDYYTHASTNEAGSADSPSFFERLKTNLAWRVDKSVELDAAWIRSKLGDSTKKVCDLGCGNGDLLMKLREAGHDVTGVEPDPSARHVACSKGLSVMPGTAESLPIELAGRRFDFVFMSHVLEHCRDPKAALKNARSILKPGGRLVVETPNNNAMGLRMAGPTWYWLDVPRHLNFFTPKSLKASFDTAGFQTEETEFRGYTRQFSQEWIRSEQTIWDRINKRTPNALPVSRQSQLKSWYLLAQSAMSSAERKYDSIRMIASVK